MQQREKRTVPAISGGRPVRTRMLPYSRQSIDDEDCRAVLNVLQADYLTTGPAIEKFETSVADYVGAKYAVAFNSGTAALHAACQAAGLQSGDEVITTPLTFAATANAVLYTGAKPIFADIDANTLNIHPDDLESALTARTKAILPVDFAGRPVEHEQIAQVARQHGLLVIEDAAHALGASYKGKRIGAWADLTMFSFHPVKAVTTGEGGVITTHRPDLYERLVQLRSHGITRDPQKCQAYQGDWYYEMQELGFNYRMTDIQAALGWSQMRKLDMFLARRRDIVRRYQQAFAGMDTLIPPPPDEHDMKPADCQSGWHLYVIRIVPERLSAGRKTIYDALRRENIGVNVHYLPVYRHPYYQQLGYPAGLCPIAEQCYESLLTLPLFPAMSDRDVEDVIDAVTKVLDYYALPK